MNRFEKAKRSAHRSLQKYGLTDWRVTVAYVIDSQHDEWVQGRCEYERKPILLDDLHVNFSPWCEVRETILHEIAHTLGNMGHGPAWQYRARALGVSERHIARYVKF